ncbi:hypothetical protein, partial [Fischerella thermalis]|uniref:hypothetical protein n=1 Tax=Fischerella thermalis TaxID=372787 RepID=UPI001CA5274D
KRIQHMDYIRPHPNPPLSALGGWGYLSQTLFELVLDSILKRTKMCEVGLRSTLREAALRASTRSVPEGTSKL